MYNSPKKLKFILNSLKIKMLFLIAIMSIIILAVIIFFTSKNLNEQLLNFVYEDLAMKNKVYVSEIAAILRDREIVIKSVRDDLERYETRGQMWIHLAAHTAESVFDDPENGQIYFDSFQKKLNYYYANEQLSADKRTPQIQIMIDEITSNNRKNSYGEGMKFFYLGIESFNEDKTIQGYDQYQDSSLWVPDPRVDDDYNPLIRPWYISGQKAGRDKVIFTEPYAEIRTKEALISGAIPINVEGKPAILAAGISIKPIMEQIQISTHTDDQLTIFSHGIEKDTIYVKSAPKYIYSSRDKNLGESFKQYNEIEVIKDQSNRDLMECYDYCKNMDSGVVEWVINGEERLVAFHTISKLGWKVFNSVSKLKTLESVELTQKKNIYISASGLIILLILLYISVSRFIRPIEMIKENLLVISETGDLSKRVTVMSEDEIGEIANAINQMLDNTATPVKKLSEKVNLISNGNLKTQIDIKARGDIAKLIDSFNDMTKQLIAFEKKNKETNPLTGLAGGTKIEEEVRKRIKNKTEFTICMIDADDFKPFNDFYGYARGNLVIKHIADLMRKAVNEYGSENDFIGHIGGDDFVILSDPDKYMDICKLIINDFDKSILTFYNEKDVLTGKIESKDRAGNITNYSTMTLTISAVTYRKDQETDFFKLGEKLAKLKGQGKKLQSSNIITEQSVSLD